jgi:O-antigen ligase
LTASNYANVLPDSRPATNTLAARRAFFWLTAFYVVYCCRPEDWIPGLSHVPLAKITGICALWGLYSIGGLKSRVLRNLPRESTYLLSLIGLLFVSGALSPIWKGGGISHAIDFAKSYIVWLLTFLLVTDFIKFRKVIYIQAASVALIALVSAVKGHDTPRLQGVLGGIYGNPNDLAFAVVLSMPFCLAFLVSAKKASRKVIWLCAMMMMMITLMLTASRAGFIDLVVTGTVCLWHFGVRGKRFYLIGATAFLGLLVMVVAGRTLKDRILATTGSVNSIEEKKAYGSYEARIYLMKRAIEGIEEYPLFGLGIGNFVEFSGDWHEVHMSYLQIAVEGGIPALILYLLFFSRGFGNLRKLYRMGNLSVETILFVGALHSSLVGFVVGALFAPEAYQFFPYFTVGYTSALLAIMQQRDPVAEEQKRAPTNLSSLARLHAETYGQV